jgi:D-aminoacyl-tRNA deacylase
MWFFMVVVFLGAIGCAAAEWPEATRGNAARASKCFVFVNSIFRLAGRGRNGYGTRMRAVLQRVKRASVTVQGETVGSIGSGLLVLLGIEPEDTAEDTEWLAQRIARLRLFADATGAWNLSAVEASADVLVVSQFTLFASTKKGTKPSWHRAAKPEMAERMCAEFVAMLNTLLPRTAQTGKFGAMMDVALVNDGPVTLILDSKVKE